MSRWRPSAAPDATRRRAALLERARDHFAVHHVLAVDTPALSRFAASDPRVDSLSVHAASGSRYFLHTSPESCMKRLLAAGYPDIYSICRVFRDGEVGRHHQPEFTMIEWYRIGFALDDIVSDTTAMISRCLDDATLSGAATVLDYRDAFSSLAGIDVLDATDDELAACAGADEDLRALIGADRNAWLDLILDTVIAPQFAENRLTVLQHFPASKAALARLCPEDVRFADRFEVFMGSRELANGYVELTSAPEQQQRIDRELEQRQRTGRDVTPRDEYLLQALEAGLPECAGVAVGVERLQMILDQTDEIGDVVTFMFEQDDG